MDGAPAGAAVGEDAAAAGMSMPAMLMPRPHAGTAAASTAQAIVILVLFIVDFLAQATRISRNMPASMCIIRWQCHAQRPTASALTR